MQRPLLNLFLATLAMAINLPAWAEVDEVSLGKARGYPAAPSLGQAGSNEHIVWTNSGGYEKFMPFKTIKPGTPSRLARSDKPIPIDYEFFGKKLTLKDYLEQRRVTSLLIMKDGVIHHEHYQYERNDRHRFNSASMGKSLVGLLVGLAIQDGAIRSVDDLAVQYLPELQGTAFDKLTVKHLLTMSTGLAWREGTAAGAQYRKMLQIMEETGGMEVVLGFRNNPVLAAPGTSYLYSSLDSELLGRVLAAAVQKNVAAYLEEKIWKPMGAEAEATWYTDRKGVERTHCCIGATTRDFARIGALLANQGHWNGQQLVPKAWLQEMTTLHGEHLRKVAIDKEPPMGYGYQIWMPAPHQIALRGHRGQVILVDPVNKVVMVQTAVYGPAPNAMSNFRELDALWAGVVSAMAAQQ
jgi:CubicO group peptidase (beta-lactamase class C family)